MGVIAQRAGKTTSIKATREVVVCAGAIGSPQLLLLSGIGPQGSLRELGIHVNCHAPGVGENLQDHLQARPVFRCTIPTTNIEAKSALQKSGIGIRYALTRTGPMAMAASLGAAFFKTRSELEMPDIQFHVQPFSKDSLVEDTHAFSAFTTSVCQLRPESRGRLSLSSPRASDYPAIHTNYLSTQLDCDTLVAGIRIARRITQCDPLKSVVTTEHAPGDEVTDRYDEILDCARSSATTIFHPTGTCKMGRDAMAVVDDRLRVHGVRGLRAADCSIMPSIISGHTNATAIMIGEKASAMILEDDSYD